jgi:hypothetical protein
MVFKGLRGSRTAQDSEKHGLSVDALERFLGRARVQ